MNLCSQGIPVMAYSYSAAERVDAARRFPDLKVCDALPDLVADLAPPGVVFVMVTAGDAVDRVLDDLLVLLDHESVVIDGGNSRYQDTERRIRWLSDHGVIFIGAGVSGGEQGARTGASVMVGGPRKGFDRVENLFKAIACQAEGESCYSWMGEGGAGHFVKMVHNGIEYGVMQLIAETYDFMRRGLALPLEQVQAWFDARCGGPLNSFLMDITAQILIRQDDLAPGLLLDRIADQAGQKGTGRWTVDAAMSLGVPVPTIVAAVTERQMSGMHAERQQGARVYGDQPGTPIGEYWEDELEATLLACILTTYAQGLALIDAASREHGWGTDLASVIRLWRGGCIIRAAMLNDILQALNEMPEGHNLLLAPHIVEKLKPSIPALRSIVSAAVAAGVPVPAMSASLAYVDSMRSERLPTHLIQAQRDYFGAHTYQRIDRPGTFHSDWEETS
jgi:6-phosphogluconate dehydrogenase